MTGFLERLALRGAGMAPAASIAPLGVRPHSAFEPSTALTDLAAGSNEIPPLPSVESAGPSSPPPPERGERAPRSAISADLRSPGPAVPGPRRLSMPEARERTERARPASRPSQADRLPARPLAAAAEWDATPALIGMPARAPTPPARLPVDGPPAPAGRIRAAPPRDVEAALDANPPAAPAVDTATPESAIVLPSLPPREAIEQPALPGRDPPPSLSLSIGRIDVEFVNPPAPVEARPGNPRSRGFADYARIRRGAPR